MQAGSSTPRRSTRRRQTPWRSIPLYFSGPSYSGTSSRAGGSHSTAILGPRSHIGGGSRTDSNVPGDIVGARAKDREERTRYSFISGHLLNADFGGSQRYQNVTILTSRANSDMKNFDNNIKRAVDYLEKLYLVLQELYIDLTTVQYGIAVDISVGSSTWASSGRYQSIRTDVYCRAQISGYRSYQSARQNFESSLDAAGLQQYRRKLSELDGYDRNVQRYVNAARNYHVRNR